MQVEFTIIAYFLFIIGIGVYSAFRIKQPGDYYVAGKKAGMWQVSGSLLATILGGSAVLGTIELSQKIGWAALWFLFSAALGLFILVPISKYVRRFGHFTLPELLGRFYGKKAEIIASIIIPLAWLGIVAAQIIAAAKILSGLNTIGYQQAALISGVVFIVYTLLGGQLSILKTDALQSLLILAGLVAILMFTTHPQHEQNIEVLQLNHLFNDSFGWIDLLILLITYSVTFIVGPDIYSRVFCAKDERTASRSVILVASILVPVSFVLTYLGVYSKASGEGIVAFAEHLLPAWAYGLFLAALLSAVMSSADTTLLTSSMIMSELITGDLEKKQALRLTRFLIVGLGILSIVIALFVTSIIQSLLLALTFFSGAFVVPTLAGLLRLRVNKKRVVIAILSGGLIALAGKILFLAGYEKSGNLLIIVSYFINSLILFYPLNRNLETV
ncbi:sodium:solute symporter family protein [Maribellus sediminis]|uniref:sodium:solute symporter family protein n=1 Tax=Maribellus sediminis TaxID=2696285 RepID=UPI0014322554|nr:sodium:solute symporter family protein [Maribellus sediminis]